jgi:Zn-finger nucleic acid-binding protein
MREVAKSGVLIDVCPDCKGTWLDRGELDKILQRAREVEHEWEEERARYSRARRDDDDDHYEHRSDYQRPHRKKRWTEIFDIFD